MSETRRPGRAGRLYRWVFGIGHERNVGGTERTVRYLGGAVSLLAAVVVLLAPLLAGIWNLALALVLAVTGGYMIYEARVRYCPLNHSLGRSTHRD